VDPLDVFAASIEEIWGEVPMSHGTPSGAGRCSDLVATEPLTVGDRVVLTTRPEDVELSDEPPSGGNRWVASVDQKVYLGESIDFRVKIGTRVLLARVHPRRTTRIGESLHVAIAPEKLLALKAAGSLLP